MQHSPDNYEETSATVITFTSGLDAGDEVTVVIPNTSLINIGTQSVSVNDDNFFTVTPPQNSGLIEVFVENTDNTFGKLYFDVTTPSAIEAYSASLFDITTGTLNGTTGIDGRITVSAANDGKIYIENRLGSSKTIVYSFIVAS